MADGQRQRNNKTKLVFRNVNMPSGNSSKVSVPAQRCKCSTCVYTVRKIRFSPQGPKSRIEYNIVSSEMTSTIRTHKLQSQGGGKFTAYDIVSIFKIKNDCLWNKYREKQSDLFNKLNYCNEKMLFHGTTACENIIKYGFDLNRAKPNGMFGTGIYFAEHSSKSNQYAYGLLGGNGCPRHADKSCYDCVRKMLLCRVSLGRMYQLKSANAMERPPVKYDSVKGVPTPGGLQYPEYTVYDPDQIYPEYLIEYKIVE